MGPFHDTGRQEMSCWLAAFRNSPRSAQPCSTPSHWSGLQGRDWYCCLVPCCRNTEQALFLCGQPWVGTQPQCSELRRLRLFLHRAVVHHHISAPEKRCFVGFSSFPAEQPAKAKKDCSGWEGFHVPLAFLKLHRDEVLGTWAVLTRNPEPK